VALSSWKGNLTKKYMADNIYDNLNKSLYKIELKSPSYEVSADQIASGSLLATFNQVMETMQSGKTLFDNTETGYILGLEEGTAKFYIGDSTNYLNWTGSALNISGTITAGAIDIGGADATSFHVDATGNMWMGHANYASAPLKVSSGGALTSTSGTFSGSITGATGAFSGTVLAANITAGTITGSTLQTAAAGTRRVTMKAELYSGGGDSSLIFYNSSNAIIGGISAANDDSAEHMTLDVGTTGIIEFGLGSVASGNTCIWTSYNAGGTYSTKVTISSLGDLTLSVGDIVLTAGDITVGGTIKSTSITGNMVITGSLKMDTAALDMDSHVINNVPDLFFTTYTSGSPSTNGQMRYYDDGTNYTFQVYMHSSLWHLTAASGAY